MRQKTYRAGYEESFPTFFYFRCSSPFMGDDVKFRMDHNLKYEFDMNKPLDRGHHESTETKLLKFIIWKISFAEKIFFC